MLSSISRAAYLVIQIVFAVLWFRLLAYFTRNIKKQSLRALLWTHSSLLILNHCALIVLGVVEIYNPTLMFYNVFCTLLFLVEPMLIFLTAGSLLYMFYRQALKKEQRVSQQNDFFNNLDIGDKTEFNETRNQVFSVGTKDSPLVRKLHRKYYTFSSIISANFDKQH